MLIIKKKIIGKENRPPSMADCFVAGFTSPNRPVYASPPLAACTAYAELAVFQASI
jgi:hypothetical protein